MIGLPRSTFYYRPGRSSVVTDSEVVELIEAIQDDLPGYGYRRITHELHRRAHSSPIYPNLYRNVIPERPDMAWVPAFSLTSFRCG